VGQGSNDLVCGEREGEGTRRGRERGVVRACDGGEGGKKVCERAGGRAGGRTRMLQAAQLSTSVTCTQAAVSLEA
jgi:hypothetical protein